MDSKEQNRALRAAADEIDHLEYGDGRSFDIEVTTAYGQVVGGERKRVDDALASRDLKKLDQQAAAAQFLVLEWDEAVIAKMLMSGRIAPEDIHGIQKHVWRMSLCHPVVSTTGVEGPRGTIAFLEYLRSLEKPFDLFESRMVVSDAAAHLSLLGVMPGINPMRKLPDGRLLGDAWWGRVDREKLVEALGVDTLTDLPGIGKGRVEKVKRFLGVDVPE